MRSVLMLGFSVFVLASCSTGTSDGEVNLTFKGGSFSGKAGSNWTDQELRDNAFGVLCDGDRKVADLTISRDANGTATISGKCV